MIKAIYHVPLSGLKLCKELGFTHVNLCLWNGVEEEFYRKAHEIGLHCIISELFNQYPGIIDFIADKKPCGECLLELPDEPNRNDIKPEAILAASNVLNSKGWQTIVTLADTHSYSGYENSANWVAFDNYELDFWHFLKLWIKIKLFQKKNHSFIVAVPAIKPGKIESQFAWWTKWIKPDGFYWYQWSLDQEGWAQGDLSQLPAVQESLKFCNKNNEQKGVKNEKWLCHS